jgi:hypothetical protein
MIPIFTQDGKKYLVRNKPRALALAAICMSPFECFMIARGIILHFHQVVGVRDFYVQFNGYEIPIRATIFSIFALFFLTTAFMPFVLQVFKNKKYPIYIFEKSLYINDKLLSKLEDIKYCEILDIKEFPVKRRYLFIHFKEAKTFKIIYTFIERPPQLLASLESAIKNQA